MNEIQVIDGLVATEVFDGESLQPLLDKLKTDVGSLVVGVENAKGRKEIASIAARISKSKTYLDGIGKELTDGWAKQKKVIDTQRKVARDFLDELKMDFRKPLTDWEDADKARITKHEQAIIEIRERGKFATNSWAEVPLSRLLVELEAVEEVSADGWDEFEHDATVTKFEAIGFINTAIEKRKQYDIEQAELEELRQLKADNEQRELEAAAAETARQEEAQKASIEKEKLEKEKLEAEQKAAQAEVDARRKIEAGQAKANAEAAAREADTKHRGKINRGAMAAFKSLGMDDDIARKVVKAIASKMIPNVSIHY